MGIQGKTTDASYVKRSWEDEPKKSVAGELLVVESIQLVLYDGRAFRGQTKSVHAGEFCG